MGGGLLGGFALGLTGLTLGAVICPEQDGDFGNALCILGVGFVGYAIGTPLGTWAVGEWVGWDGSLLATIGGSVAGAAIFGGVLTLLESYDVSVPPDLGWALVVGLPAAGAVGYQLSADWNSGASVLVAPQATMIPVIHLNF